MSDVSASDDNGKRNLDSSASIANKTNEENSLHIGRDVLISTISDTGKETSPNTDTDRPVATVKTPGDDESDLSPLKISTSGQRNNEKIVTVNISPDTRGLTQHKIRLYVLRNAKENDTFVIQALFSCDIKFNFEREKVFNSENVFCTYVHYLTLNLMLNDTGDFYVMREGRLYRIDEYHLRISLRSFTGSKHFINEKKRSLYNCLPTWHQFLFNIDFSDNSSTKAPGKYNMVMIISKTNYFYS